MYIERKFNQLPTIFNGNIEENMIIANSANGSFGNMIVDKRFINDMQEISDSLEIKNKLISDYGAIYNMVANYYFTKGATSANRNRVYNENLTIDDEGDIIGTNLSALKLKNVAKCSERSIAAYCIINNLYNEGKIDRKPSLVLSYLKTPDRSEMPHAFLLLDKEEAEYPDKHILFDIQNYISLKFQDGDSKIYVGLYPLTEDEYDDLLSGVEIEPESCYKYMYGDSVEEIGPRRIYGALPKKKSITL